MINFLKSLHVTTQQIAFICGAVTTYLVGHKLLPPADAGVLTGALITICTVFTAKQQPPTPPTS